MLLLKGGAAGDDRKAAWRKDAERLFCWEKRGMLEIAGLAISSIGLAADLTGRIADWAKWEERDVKVDSEWLQLALEKGVLDGTEQDYEWRMLKNAPTLELKKTHNVVVALNRERKIRYRIVKKTRNKELAILLKRLGG